MNAMRWILFTSFFQVWHCFENLCTKNTTSILLSSYYANNKAYLANDGNVKTTERYCSYTIIQHTKAWLQVDLGEQYSINNVKIYYRSEGDLDDQYSWKQYRFRQFYLDVSDLPASETNTTQRTRCYTDKTTYTDLPPNIIDIPCQQTARYVIVETTYDAPEDDPTEGAILEICEIEVYDQHLKDSSNLLILYIVIGILGVSFVCIQLFKIRQGIPSSMRTKENQHDKKSLPQDNKDTINAYQSLMHVRQSSHYEDLI
uniref:F5/8 type C domain-containing protein n=1 Tax=Magallana gigas TaxID=29159 RepID=A0A8W8NPC7_MAGGI